MFVKPFPVLLSLLMSAPSFACTDEFKPVCGYWMHTSKTQSFRNECQARAAGALVRHKGSCQTNNVKEVIKSPGKNSSR
jgi:hypothetical protein